MNAYEAKQEARRERMRARAEKLRKIAAAEFRKADLREEVSGIPFGQPILVGHHSERRHRNAIDRANRALDRGIKAERLAKALEARAATPSRAVSSDDPDAIIKLRAQLAKAEADQERMRATNKLVRKKDRAGLAAMGYSESGIEALFKPDFCGRVGYPDYALTNNSANIRRIKHRLAELAMRQADREPTEREVCEGLKIIENTEANRVQIVFDGKPPADVRTELKGRGFRWSPSEGAWQRHLNGSGTYAAQAFAEWYTKRT